jgi:hypothetical protein
MLHHFMREQEIFGWNWGGEHKGAYLNFGAIICLITEVLHFLSHSGPANVGWTKMET